ncbi:MAG TPA: amidohydrolase family protein [Terracidiphilus sp.]|nr:amidohydrolase family protein [Terracidiphilus sp.]
MIRLDAHQHFWKYDPAEYGWINEHMMELRRDFLPEDLKPLLDSAGFEGSIAVQARQSVEETTWLLDLAEQHDFIRGVVGWIDLCSPRGRDQLKTLAGRRKLRGVRHVVQDEPDDRFMMRTDFLHGIRELADFSLVYDILVYPRQLPAAIELVGAFPQQKFVLDHIAKPHIASAEIEPWRSDLRELAKFSNVSCKLSGMVTEARWKEWKPESFTPYLNVVFEAFGPARLMIGSDWPVCTLSAEYSTAISIVMDFMRDLSSSERDGILGGNCARTYGVEA